MSETLLEIKGIEISKLCVISLYECIQQYRIEGTRYDWARGAYMQAKAIVRTSYELEEEIQKIGASVTDTIYPFGTISPLWTWTESYIYALLGIPTIESHYEGLNFWGSYHSNSDTKETCFYDDSAFASSHRLYGTILQKLDELAVRPLHFEHLFRKMYASIDDEIVTDGTQ